MFVFDGNDFSTLHHFYNEQRLIKSCMRSQPIHLPFFFTAICLKKIATNDAV